MSEVTRLIDAAAAGDRMAAESPGHTLDATALVHEAYLRLIGEQRFDHRGHFFAAAADVAKLHLFAGLSVDESAAALGTSRATAYRNWAYARAWLQDALDENP